MRILTTISEMRAACRGARSKGERLGFVPTMGALHDGHLSLVRAAKASCGIVAASIFVNPTQFGPNEDLAKYPRSFERDCELLEREEVDLLFAPSVEQMYPQGAGFTYADRDRGMSDCAAGGWAGDELAQ
jgi:pantoate--beta-alanine ligase